MSSYTRSRRRVQKTTEKVAKRVSKQEKKTAKTIAKGTRKIEKAFEKTVKPGDKLFDKAVKAEANKKKREKQTLKSINKNPLPRASTSGRAGGRIIGGLGSGPFGPRVR